MDTAGEEESGTNGESIINIYTLPCVEHIASEKLLYKMEPSLGLCDDLEKRFGGKGGRLRREGTYV